MASTIQIYAPDPNAPPEEYARAVTASIQDLVAGRRPRDPALSGASTGRLIFEGLVESVKVYRLYQQEKMSRVEETKGNRRDGRRHRRSNDEGGSHNRVRHCKSRPTKQHDGGDVSDDYEQERDQRTYHSPEDNPELHLTRHLMSGALHAAESALGFGPDGTPFGSLPTRGKGTGWLPHVKAVHRHIRAEQDAGLRSKGLAEKCIVDFLQKRRAAQSVEKDRGKEPVVEETGGEGDEGSGRGGNRSWKPRKRRGERQAGSNERALPRSGGNTPSGEQEVHPPSQAEEFVQQPALSARSVPPQVQPSIEESRIHHNREGGAAVEEENAFAEARTGTPCVPVVTYASRRPQKPWE
ncbi:hypothetical protein B5807_04871 [Epicoccum nigrum]|uniref:Uncharacterized protein n=1 Tax=Epicoccum nigrum TaxID=105696 RepID=A0A1Y2M2U4_EPING|nr:hypothetical protein B5807_04871 [Epicoccum nigrum]